MSAQSQSALTLWCQLDLVVCISKINLGVSNSASQLLHQLFWERHRMTMVLQLVVDAN